MFGKCFNNFVDVFISSLPFFEQHEQDQKSNNSYLVYGTFWQTDNKCENLWDGRFCIVCSSVCAHMLHKWLTQAFANPNENKSRITVTAEAAWNWQHVWKNQQNIRVLWRLNLRTYQNIEKSTCDCRWDHETIRNRK